MSPRVARSSEVSWRRERAAEDQRHRYLARQLSMSLCGGFDGCATPRVRPARELRSARSFLSSRVFDTFRAPLLSHRALSSLWCLEYRFPAAGGFENALSIFGKNGRKYAGASDAREKPTDKALIPFMHTRARALAAWTFHFTAFATASLLSLHGLSNRACNHVMVIFTSFEF